MQVIISLKKGVKKQSLTKRCALTVFRTVHSIAHHSRSVPSKLSQSFDDLRAAWVESQVKNV